MATVAAVALRKIKRKNSTDSNGIIKSKKYILLGKSTTQIPEETFNDTINWDIICDTLYSHNFFKNLTDSRQQRYKLQESFTNNLLCDIQTFRKDICKAYYCKNDEKYIFYNILYQNGYTNLKKRHQFYHILLHSYLKLIDLSFKNIIYVLTAIINKYIDQNISKKDIELIVKNNNNKIDGKTLKYLITKSDCNELKQKFNTLNIDKYEWQQIYNEIRLNWNIGNCKLTQNDNKEMELSNDMFRTPNSLCEIGTEIDIFQISHIDLVSETFHASFYIELQWHATKEEYISYKQDPLNYLPSYIPRFMFGNGECDINEIQTQGGNKGYRIVKNGDNGSWNILIKDKIRYPVMNICLYKFVGIFTERFELQNFPFDVQDLQINIECDDNVDIAIFVPSHKEFCHHSGFLSLKYSALQEYKVHSTLLEYGLIEYEMDMPPFATLTARMKIERNYDVYFGKIVVFAFVTTASTLFAFSMDPVESLPDRYEFAVTLLLTAVAFQFVVDTELPKLPYLTILDMYIIMSFIFLFLVMFGIGMIPMCGDRYEYQPGDKDTIYYADKFAFWCSLGLLIVYHVYFGVKIVIARKYEKLKIGFDKWDLQKNGIDDVDENTLEISNKEHCRIQTEIWEKYINPMNYTDCIKRDYSVNEKK